MQGREPARPAQFRHLVRHTPFPSFCTKAVTEFCRRRCDGVVIFSRNEWDCLYDLVSAPYDTTPFGCSTSLQQCRARAVAVELNIERQNRDLDHRSPPVFAVLVYGKWNLFLRWFKRFEIFFCFLWRCWGYQERATGGARALAFGVTGDRHALEHWPGWEEPANRPVKCPGKSFLAGWSVRFYAGGGREAAEGTHQAPVPEASDFQDTRRGRRSAAGPVPQLPVEPGGGPDDQRFPHRWARKRGSWRSRYREDYQCHNQEVQGDLWGQEEEAGDREEIDIFPAEEDVRVQERLCTGTKLEGYPPRIENGEGWWLIFYGFKSETYKRIEISRSISLDF